MATNAEIARVEEKSLVCIKINRTLHPNRESALPLSQGAISTALIVTSQTHNNYPTHNRDFSIISFYLGFVKNYPILSLIKGYFGWVIELSTLNIKFSTKNTWVNLSLVPK